MESAAPKGEWTAPAAQEISVAMAVSDFSARWRGSGGLQSHAVAAGTISICELNQSKTLVGRGGGDRTISAAANTQLIHSTFRRIRQNDRNG
jgi:hypothetical protein